MARPPAFVRINWAVGFAVLTGKLCDSTDACPTSSVTVSTTAYSFAAVNTCVVTWPLPVAPSPKFQSYRTMLRPGDACTAAALNTTVSLMTGSIGEFTQSPDGAWGAPISTACDFEANKPRSFVTVSVTVNLPIEVNVWFTTLPDPDWPSPNVQE